MGAALHSCKVLVSVLVNWADASVVRTTAANNAHEILLVQSRANAEKRFVFIDISLQT
jgi:hypothetical protein